MEQGASNKLDAEEGSAAKAELADAESMDEDVLGSTRGDSSRYNGTSADYSSKHITPRPHMQLHCH